MGDLVTWIREARPSGRSYPCVTPDYGLRCGIALRAARSCIRLLGGDDAVAHSTDFVLRISYANFLPRHFAGGEPVVGIRNLGWRASFCNGVNLWPVGFPLSATSFGKWRSCRYFFWGAVVCRGTEATVPGSP